MKVKDKVYHYEVKLDFLKDKVEQKVEEHKIIGVNAGYIAINDDCFTSIKTKQVYRGDEDTLFN